MKKRIGMALLTSVLAAAASCSSDGVSSSNSGPDKQSLPTPATTANTAVSDPSMTTTNNANAAAPAQGNFYIEAAQGGMAEVELGQLAAQKANDPEVKSFGQMMVADHGKANAELQTVAGRKQVTLPATLAPNHQATMTQLQGLSGADFDRAYVNAMVTAHEKDVALFERQAANDADPDAKALAAKTLPTLKKHLEAIKDIQSKLK